MKEWKGNEKIFRTYVEGKPGLKAPVEKVKGRDQISSFAEAEQSADFGGLLQEGIIDISFDDAEMADSFLDMAEENQWLCMALRNPENNHLHTFWKNSYERIGKLSAKDQKLAVGLIADIHGGDTYIPLRVSGADRYPPEYDIWTDEEYQEVPEELLPVSTRINLWGLQEGSRNDALSGMALYLANHTRFGKEVIKRILANTNGFVFGEPLPEEELNTILRDETFKGVKESVPLSTKSAAVLYNEEIPPVEFIINGLVPVGLTILASPPKYGKSWMCLDMAIAAAAGTDFLGFTTNQCGVLYLALEDRYDRLKQRMIQLIGEDVPPAGFEIGIESEMLGEGFIEQIEKFLQDHPETKLIIVDTFIKIRGEPKRNESAYKTDSREAGILKKFADQHKIAVLLVTHTRKGIDPDDPFVNISGTYGIAGAADDMIVLSRDKRNDTVTKMSVTGRDVDEDNHAIVRNPDTGKWIRQKEAYDQYMQRAEISAQKAEYMISNIKKTLHRLLEENEGSWTGFCAGIIDKSKEYGTPIALTSQKLGKKLSEINNFMYEDGILHTEIKQGTGAKKHKFEKT